MGKHRWTKKAKKWERYGNYIYKEEECACGCVRRITIDEKGYEIVESYTINEDTTVKRPPCIRNKKQQ